MIGVDGNRPLTLTLSPSERWGEGTRREQGLGCQIFGIDAPIEYAIFLPRKFDETNESPLSPAFSRGRGVGGEGEKCTGLRAESNAV